MPKVTEEHILARKKQILAAAALRFSRKGFHKTTMQDICEEASLSPGAIYRYFSGKVKIITAMAEEKMARNVAIIKDIKANMNGDLEKAFNDLAEAFFGKLQKENRDSLRLDVELWSEALRDPRVLKFVRHSVENHVNALRDIIKAGQERGDLSAEVDATAVAQILTSLFRGMILLKAIDETVDVTKYVEAALLMVRSLVKKRAASS